MDHQELPSRQLPAGEMPMPESENTVSLEDLVNNASARDIYKNLKMIGEG